MCVFFPSILDIKFVGRTSRGHTGGRSHRILRVKPGNGIFDSQLVRFGSRAARYSVISLKRKVRVRLVGLDL